MDQIKAKGSVQARSCYELKFKTSGKLKELFISVGDKVKKGQILAKLDDSPIQNQLDSALLNYRKQRAKFDETSLNYPDPPINDEQKLKKEQAQAELDSSVKEVEAVKYEMDQLELKSPIEGVVENIENLYPGLNITPGTQTITIFDPSTFNFVAEVNQMDIPKIKVGQYTKVTLDAYPTNTIGGKVINIGITPTSAKDVSYPVQIELPPSPELRTSLTGNVIFLN